MKFLLLMFIEREILLMHTCLCPDSVLTAFSIVSLPVSKLWGIAYFDDIFILLVLVLIWDYSVYNQKPLLKLIEQRIYFYELIQFFPNNWKQDVLYWELFCSTMVRCNCSCLPVVIFLRNSLHCIISFMLANQKHVKMLLKRYYFLI